MVARTAERLVRTRDPRRPVLGGAVVLVLVFATLLAFTLARSREHRIREAQSLTEQLVRSAEEHAQRTLGSIDATLSGLGLFLERSWRGEPLRGGELRNILKLLEQQAFAIADIAIVNPHGEVVNAASGTAGTAHPAAFDEIVAAAAASSGRSLVIGRPLSRDDDASWSLLMARKFETANGETGFLVAEAVLDAFTSYYRSINSPVGTRIALLTDDATLVAAEPPLDARVGTKAADTASVLLLATERRTAVVAEGGFLCDGPAIVAWRRLASWPLVVAVASDQDQVLATWRSEALLYLGLLGAAIAAAAVAGAGLVRLLERRLAAERAEKEAQIRLARGIDAMSDGFMLFDAQDRVVMWNAKYVAFFPYLDAVLRPGVTFEEVLAHTVTNAPLDVGAGEREAWRRWRRERQRNPGEPFEQPMADGRCFHTVIRKTPGGETVVVIREISELKRAERAARHAKDAAEQASRTKSAFLANMSHELRTPLNAILGFSDIIKGGMFGEHRRYMDYAADINTAGRHLLRLVNDILDLSKIESGAMELHEGEVRLDMVLDSCAELVRSRAREAGVKLTLHATSRVPPVYADELRLKQVLLNLLSNAVKFTPAGGSVEAGVAQDADGGTVLTVSDTGIGMQEEDLAVALQDFGQVDSSLARRFEGSGLGLPLSRRLVELHGGTLEVESELNRGTTVTVRLPAWRTQELRPAA